MDSKLEEILSYIALAIIFLIFYFGVPLIETGTIVFSENIERFVTLSEIIFIPVITTLLIILLVNFLFNWLRKIDIKNNLYEKIFGRLNFSKNPAWKYFKVYLMLIWPYIFINVLISVFFVSAIGIFSAEAKFYTPIILLGYTFTYRLFTKVNCEFAKTIKNVLLTMAFLAFALGLFSGDYVMTNMSNLSKQQAVVVVVLLDVLILESSIGRGIGSWLREIARKNERIRKIGKMFIED